MDEDKTIYNTESQKRRNTDLVKRSRFYQGVIDSSLLAPGTRSFNLLNDTCIIMITPFDLFGKGKYCYTFRPYCEEDPSVRLEDGAVRIFLNSPGRNREDAREEGLAIGKKAAELVFLRRLLQNKHRDEETVAEDLDLPLEYVHKVNELLKSYPTESDEEIAARMIK